VEAQRIGKMENARSHLEIFRDISAENVLSGFHILLSFPNFLFFLCSSLELFWLKKKEIYSAVVAIQIFLSGLTSTFDSDFHALEEITRRALGAVESEVVLH
jgi:hypothetical protein